MVQQLQVPGLPIQKQAQNYILSRGRADWQIRTSFSLLDRNIHGIHEAIITFFS
jgi:hypothetical protein